MVVVVVVTVKAGDTDEGRMGRKEGGKGEKMRKNFMERKVGGEKGKGRCSKEGRKERKKNCSRERIREDERDRENGKVHCGRKKERMGKSTVN